MSREALRALFYAGHDTPDALVAAARKVALSEPLQVAQLQELVQTETKALQELYRDSSSSDIPHCCFTQYPEWLKSE